MYANIFCYAGQVPILRYFEACMHKQEISQTPNVHTLESVERANYLGVTLSEDLSWTPHVDNTAAKALRTLGFLRRNMFHCTDSVRERTYSKTFVKRPFSKRPLVFKTNYRLMRVKSIAKCSKRSILQYFRPSLSNYLSLRYLF